MNLLSKFVESNPPMYLYGPWLATEFQNNNMGIPNQECNGLPCYIRLDGCHPNLFLTKMRLDIYDLIYTIKWTDISQSRYFCFLLNT